MPLLHISILDALIIFFLTLGPLKAIAPFAQLTQGTDPAFRQTLAWRGTAIATSIVMIVALLGALVLENWHVSVAAIVITGGIILFCQAFQLIMQPSPVAPPPQPNLGQAPPTMAMAQFSLALPALVTAPGITAIVGFMAIAGGDWTQRGIIFAALLVIMGLNLGTLLNMEAILKRGPSPGLKVLGWVMAILQAALAAQYIINGLVRIGALPPLVP
jgi:multiple antibiotic resistance protein